MTHWVGWKGNFLCSGVQPGFYYTIAPVDCLTCRFMAEILSKVMVSSSDRTMIDINDQTRFTLDNTPSQV